MTLHAPLRQALLALLLALPLGVAADVGSLPVPADTYPDRDVAADEDILSEPADAAHEQALDELLGENPDDAALLAQRGQLRYRLGRGDEGEADYRQALQIADAGSVQARRIRWSYGWAQLVAGNLRDALTSWQEAERLHGGRPSWVPHTYAAVLWLMDEQNAAVDYYDAAVRSDPERWGDVGAMTAATRHWQALERDAIRGVFDAWQAQMPQP